MNGYRGAPIDRGNVPNDELIELTQPNEEGGEWATLNILAKGAKFTAIVTYNDAMATGAVSVLADNWTRVPEEVLVISFDDVIYARYLRPKLTTMRYHY